MAYELSMPEEFFFPPGGEPFDDGEENQNFDSAGRPVTVYGAVSLLPLKTQKELRHANDLEPEASLADIVESIREINTSNNLSSPTEVWVVPDGTITVKVWDSTSPGLVRNGSTSKIPRHINIHTTGYNEGKKRVSYDDGKSHWKATISRGLQRARVQRADSSTLERTGTWDIPYVNGEFRGRPEGVSAAEWKTNKAYLEELLGHGFVPKLKRGPLQLSKDELLHFLEAVWGIVEDDDPPAKQVQVIKKKLYDLLDS